MKVLVLGGGWCGLATALLFTRDGHDVTVLEKDPAGPPQPGDAWADWQRPGVGQFRQPHLVLPAGHRLLQTELPDLNDALRRAGGAEIDVLEGLRALLPGLPLDDPARRYVTVNARRPVSESVVAAVAAETVEIRRGAAVAELMTGASDGGAPHVTGVRLASGEQLAADLVVDAMGRRSPLCDWLAAIGCRAPGYESEEQGFAYYTRYFRSRDGSLPALRGPVNTPIGTFSLLTVHSDNDTWSVTVVIGAHDHELKQVRRADLFTRVVAACPLHAHWMDGETIGEVAPMSGISAQRRSFVRDGAPVVTGVLAIGDAWASTNPSLGRGLSIGLLQVRRLRDALRMGLDPAKLQLHWIGVTVEEFEPWYRSCVLSDRDRAAEITAILDGTPVPAPNDPTMLIRYAGLAGKDAELILAAFDIISVHATPEQVLARPGIAERVAAVGSAPLTRTPFPGPDRTQLRSLLSSD